MPNYPPMKVRSTDPQSYIAQVFEALAADPRARQATELQGAAWSPQLQQTEQPTGPTGIAMPNLENILMEAETQPMPDDVIGNLLQRLER
jgi:hypothetical protein